MANNLGGLFLWCNAKVPEVDDNIIPSVSSSLLDKKTILNEGAKEFVRIARCLPKEKKINCSANTQSYSISSNIPDFMEMREEGVWHYRTASNTATWQRLVPTSQRELDDKFPTWRTQSASDQVRNYYQDGDVMGFFYTPSTAVTNGLWIYYYATSSDMSSTSHYPFTGTTTQDPRLAAYETLLVDYYEAKALDIMGYKDDASNKLKIFYDKCTVAKSQLQSRRDLVQNANARPKTFLSYARNSFKRR